MPIYQLSRAHLAEEVAKIEAKGERIRSVTPDGATMIVITEVAQTRQAGGLETRA